MDKRDEAQREILRVVLPYVFFAGLWILLSDRLLEIVSLGSHAQTYKGLAFVTATSLLLFTLMRSEARFRARSQAVLAETEERLKALGDNLPESYVYQYAQGPDRTTGFIYISAGVQMLHGVTPEEAINDPELIRRQVDPDFLPLLLEAENKSINNMTDMSIEVPICTSEGKHRWIEIHSHPHLSSDGSVIWDGVTTDVTKRKEAEASMSRNEHRLNRLFSLSPTIIYTLDNISNSATWVSPNITAMLGYSMEEVMAPGWWANNIYPDDRENTLSVSANDLVPVIHEYRFLKKNGDIVWLQDEMRLIPEAKGRPAEIIGAWIDITERKQAETERIHREVAEQASKAKSAFVANMSHEIRTPLNAVLGFAQILDNDTNLNPKQAEQAKTIASSALQLLHLVNDILELSKIESGKLNLHETVFSLHDMLTDLEIMFRTQTDAKGLTLNFEKTRQVPRCVFADGGKFRQILVNLIGNAVKFTQKGGIVVRIRVSNDNGAPDMETKNIRLYIDVDDSGPGIMDEDKEHIFEWFRQAKAGNEEGGTGLGLSISRHLAEILGGTLIIDSTPGKGSCFSFYVPVQISDCIVYTDDEYSLLPIAFQKDKDPLRILLADDQETNRRLLNNILQPVGFETREAANGQEALEIFESWEPHAVLMDIKMPVMDGYEAKRRMEAFSNGRVVPIIAVTASVFDNEEKEIIKSGFDGYVLKPFTSKQIFDVLGKTLGLQYEYAQKTASYLSGTRELTAPNIAFLPKSLVLNIKSAAEKGDIVELKKLIVQAADLDAGTAYRLQILADQYKYEKLIQLLQEGFENGQPS